MTGQHITIDGGYVMDGSLPGAKYWEESEAVAMDQDRVIGRIKSATARAGSTR